MRAMKFSQSRRANKIRSLQRAGVGRMRAGGGIDLEGSIMPVRRRNKEIVVSTNAHNDHI